MPEGSFSKVRANCPFYRTDDRQTRRVMCEGIVDGSSLAIYFSRRADYETQMMVFCCQHYEKCEVYRMLMEKRAE